MVRKTKPEYTVLNGIDSPADLKNLSGKELKTLAAELRDYIVQCVSKTGGHLSSSLGSVELAIALHTVFDTPDDRIVWDVGHQAYAHKILTGRREKFPTIRQYKGLSGFPKRAESVYDTFGTGHSSTSISAALGMAIGSSLAGHKDRWHVAVIGDGALTGGMAIEALNHAGDCKEGVKLLIVLNDNNCSISPPVGALSGNLGKLISTSPIWKARQTGKKMLKNIPMLWDFARRMEKQTVNFLSPPSSIFSSYDLNYFGPIDGHDLPGLVHMFKRLKALEPPFGPMVLHVVTQKGKGYKLAEENPTIYHGVAPFNPEKGIEEKVSAIPTYTEVFSQWVCDMAAKDKSLYAITPAMREGSGLVEFEKKFPERFRDVAIAEQHAVTYAAGLACEGIHPVVAIYSTFAQRAYDQILHDVAIQNLPVLFAVDRAGIVGADGTTHHGVFDIAYLRSIPNMTIMTPSNEAECRAMFTTGFRMKTPAVVRYPRAQGIGAKSKLKFETVKIGESVMRRQGKATKGKRVTIFAFGPMVNSMKEVAEMFDATLIDMRFVKPLDEKAVLAAAKVTDLVVTAEEGVIAGGAGSAVLECLARNGIVVKTLQVGVPDVFFPQGTQTDLTADCGMDAKSVIAAIKKRLN